MIAEEVTNICRAVSSTCDRPADVPVLTVNGWMFDACWDHARELCDPARIGRSSEPIPEQ